MEELKPNSFYVKAIAILAAACVILLVLTPFALKEAAAKNEKIRSWIEATAEITDFDFTVTDEKQQIIVTFSDKSGNVNTVPLGFFSAHMYMGMQLPIVYDPNNVTSIMYTGDNDFFVIYGGGIMLAAAGLISGVLAIVLFVKLRRNKAQQTDN